MKKHNLTDEEILSYIMGDCEESLSDRITLQLKEDAVLRRRMESLSFIKSEIKKTPALYKLREKKELRFSRLTGQLALGVMIFTIGLFTQSNFEILSKKNMEVYQEEVSTSALLSWDDARSLSLM